MTTSYVDILWALMLLGVALWTTCCLVFNPVLKSIRVMGLAVAYGVVSLAYELWARHHYAGTARAPRPLVLVDAGVLDRTPFTHSH